MTKKRKLAAYNAVKVEVKEENIMGNDYLVAKGRLKGALKQLINRSGSDTDSSDDEANYSSRARDREGRKRKSLAPSTPVRHTYVVKLFDRSVDLAKFEENTPLYPICRAWMANLPRNSPVIVKRRNSTPEPDHLLYNGNNSEIVRLPPPYKPFETRIPSPLLEQQQNKNKINLNYDDKPPVPKDVLIRNHLQRWVNVKKKWIETAQKNEERYHRSVNLLQTINNKALEVMNQ